MVLYYCSRCGYTNINRSVFLKHLNRKNVCKQTLSEVSIEEIKEQYGMIGNLNTNEHKLNTNEHKLNTNEHKLNNNKNMCIHCLKIFSCNSSLVRHIKYYCKEKENKLIILKKENEIILKENELMKKELENNNKKIENNTIITKGNNINSNNTNNIVINNFGNENIDFLSSNYITELSRIPLLAIPKLIKDIHFNDNHPENKNIRLTNPRNKYIEVYEDKWKYKNKKETLDDILILINEVIENNYESNKETMEESIKKTLINYFNQFDNNKIVRDKATENAELSILNNS